MIKNHADLLDQYALLTVCSGLNITAGQQLVISAPIEAVELVRRVTCHAYAAGASLVTTLYNDDRTTLARFQATSDASFDTAAGWLFDGMARPSRAGRHVLPLPAKTRACSVNRILKKFHAPTGRVPRLTVRRLSSLPVFR